MNIPMSSMTLLVDKFLSLLLNKSLQSEIMQNHVQSQISLALLQLLMNNQVQFAFL